MEITGITIMLAAIAAVAGIVSAAAKIYDIVQQHRGAQQGQSPSMARSLAGFVHVTFWIACVCVAAAVAVWFFATHHVVSNEREPTTTAPTLTAVTSTVEELPPKRPEPSVPKIVYRGGLRFVRIPAGTAELGCAGDDTDCKEDETPHRVRFESGFQIMEREVTVSDYLKCVQAQECDPLLRQNADNAAHDLPVRFVDADDAERFCRWLGGELPTEDEWEYAARGGKEGFRFPWGNELRQDLCVIARAQPSRPASCPPNAYGLFDVVGNVGEWTRDRGLNAPKTFFVVRGGSFATDPPLLRLSARNVLDRDTVGPSIGLRCAAADLDERRSTGAMSTIDVK